MFDWQLNQANQIDFVMVDSAGNEVAGLGSGFTLQLCKSGGSFAPSAGTKAEIGSGWYSYLSTAGEADTPGPVAVKVTGAGAVQQNLEYVVKQRNAGAIAYTYTVTNQSNGQPVQGVKVVVTTDLAGTNVVFSGYTDTFGVLRDAYGDLPRLDAGVYQFFKSKPGWVDVQNPDTKTVS